MIGMCSYLDHRYPVGFAFIPSHRILGTVPRGGAGGQNLEHVYNMIVTIINFL